MKKILFISLFLLFFLTSCKKEYPIVSINKDISSSDIVQKYEEIVLKKEDSKQFFDKYFKIRMEEASDKKEERNYKYTISFDDTKVFIIDSENVIITELNSKKYYKVPSGSFSFLDLYSFESSKVGTIGTIPFLETDKIYYFDGTSKVEFNSSEFKEALSINRVRLIDAPLDKKELATFYINDVEYTIYNNNIISSGDKYYEAIIEEYSFAKYFVKENLDAFNGNKITIYNTLTTKSYSFDENELSFSNIILTETKRKYDKVLYMIETIDDRIAIYQNNVLSYNGKDYVIEGGINSLINQNYDKLKDIFETFEFSQIIIDKIKVKDLTANKVKDFTNKDDFLRVVEGIVFYKVDYLNQDASYAIYLNDDIVFVYSDNLISYKNNMYYSLSDDLAFLSLLDYDFVELPWI